MKISNRVSSLPPSGIRKMFEIASQYDDIINLCIGEPDFETPHHIVEAGCYGLNNGYTKYVANAGLPDLRAAVAKKACKYNKIDCTSSNVMITNGAGQSLMSVFQCLINPGDEVIISDPYFPNYLGYLMLAKAQVIKVKTYEEHGFHLQYEDLKKAITSKTKAILINFPCNPTGAVMERDELIRIGELALEHNIVIVSDEPYESIVYDGREPFSLASVPSLKDNVVTVNSLSKSYAMTGWRVGYTIGPQNLIDSMTLLQESLTSSVNASAQYAAVIALESDQAEVVRMKNIYEDRRNTLVEGLNEINGIKCSRPEGAFYVFANIKDTGMESEELAKKLIEECQVIVTPGNAFGDGGKGYIRISYASGIDSLKEALYRIKNVLGEK